MCKLRRGCLLFEVFFIFEVVFIFFGGLLNSYPWSSFWSLPHPFKIIWSTWVSKNLSSSKQFVFCWFKDSGTNLSSINSFSFLLASFWSFPYPFKIIWSIWVSKNFYSSTKFGFLIAEEDKFLDTHIGHIILKGGGMLQKEARRKEEELRFDMLVSLSLNHQKLKCVGRRQVLRRSYWPYYFERVWEAPKGG